MALAALAALAALFALRGEPARPNVLLITIDTLRADAVGEDTPFLAELAGRGRRFRRARTPVPLTLPAHATILTGLLPAAHGLRDNTAPPLEGTPLLAREFAEEGYATAAFVASVVLDRRFGLDAGFESYRAPGAPVAGAPRFASLDATDQVDRVLRWLEARPKDRPYFVWVHLWEPHDPYRPYDGDERRPGTAESDPPAELYRGEVRKADAAVEAILAGVDLADTVVLVTADHGEALGEHGERTHGHLCYGATMDVPLILAGPDVPAGEEDGPCSLEDVAPTLRALCGLEERPTDGRDLLDLPAQRVLVGESLYANRLYGWSQQAVATDGRHTLLDGGPRLELFDRREDPGETSPLESPERHAVYETLDRALTRYKNVRARHEPAGFSPEGSPYGSVRRPQTAFLDPAANRALPDVRDHLSELARLYAFRGLVAAGQRGALEKLRPEMEAWAARDPGNPAPCLALGRAGVLVLGDFESAAAWLEEAVRRGYPEEDLRGLLQEARRRAAASKTGGR